MKYLEIIKFDVKKRWKSLLIISAVLLLFLMMMGSAYNSLAPQYTALFKNAPPVFEAFIGDTAAIGSPAGFLNAEMFSLMVPLMLVIVSIGYGSSAIGSEIENGQIELIISRNISRLSLIATKIITLILLNLSLGLVTWLSIAISSKLFDFNISLVGAFWASLSAVLLSLSFGSLALLASVIMGRKDVALGFSTGVFTIMYVWQSLVNVIDKLRELDFLTIFKFYQSGKLLMNQFQPVGLVVMASISLLLILVAMIVFNKKDINVR